MQFLTYKLNHRQFMAGVSQLVNVQAQELALTIPNEEVLNITIELLQRYGWPDEENWWLWRDELRFHFNIYKKLPNMFYERAEQLGIPRRSLEGAPVFLRQSNDTSRPDMVARTPERNNRRQTDVHEDMRVGRLLSRMYGNLADHEIRDLVSILAMGGFELAFADTSEEAARVYENGPGSCMTSSGSVRTRQWTYETHPARVYGTPDVQVAYLKIPHHQDGRDLYVARTVVAMPTRQIVRRYGDEKILPALIFQNFNTENDGNRGAHTLEGLRLNKIDINNSDETIAAPYFDCYVPALTMHEDGEHLRPVTRQEIDEHCVGGLTNFRPSRQLPVLWTAGGTGGTGQRLGDARRRYINVGIDSSEFRTRPFHVNFLNWLRDSYPEADITEVNGTETTRTTYVDRHLYKQYLLDNVEAVNRNLNRLPPWLEYVDYVQFTGANPDIVPGYVPLPLPEGMASTSSIQIGTISPFRVPVFSYFKLDTEHPGVDHITEDLYTFNSNYFERCNHFYASKFLDIAMFMAVLRDPNNYVVIFDRSKGMVRIVARSNVSSLFHQRINVIELTPFITGMVDDIIPEEYTAIDLLHNLRMEPVRNTMSAQAKVFNYLLTLLFLRCHGTISYSRLREMDHTFTPCPHPRSYTSIRELLNTETPNELTAA